MKQNLFLCLILLGLVGCGSSPKNSTDGARSRSTNRSDVGDELSEEMETPASKKKKDAIRQEEANASATKLSERPNEPALDEKLKRLVRAVQQKNETVVLDLVSQNLSANPNDVKTLNALGLFYLQSERPALARITFRKALEIDKNSSALYNNVGLTYMQENDISRALDEFRRALDLDPANAAAAANMGAIAVKFGNYKRAAALLEKPYRLDPKNEGVAYNFARASAELGDFQTAEKIYEEMVSNRNRNPLVYLGYGAALVQQKKDPTKARQILNKVKILTSDPDILRATDVVLKRMETKS